MSEILEKNRATLVVRAFQGRCAGVSGDVVGALLAAASAAEAGGSKRPNWFRVSMNSWVGGVSRFFFGTGPVRFGTGSIPSRGSA